MTRLPYRFWNRDGTIYFKLRAGNGWKTTGKHTQADAMDYVLGLLREQGVSLSEHIGGMSFAEYAAPFFLWNSCPHCKRVRASGGQIGPEHVANQRSLLERFILSDPFSQLLITKIKRGDCIDLRDRLIEKLKINVDDREDPAGKRTVNAAMTVVSTIFSEGVERGELDFNPAAKLNVKYRKTERGIFTAQELRSLFPAGVEDLGPWDSLTAKTAFLLAATCGLRRNEVRALRWSSIDFEASVVRVHESFKGQSRPGLPKWDRRRETPLTNGAARHLLALRGEGDAEYVFIRPDGKTIGTEFWEDNFNRALERLGLNRKERSLVPHSLRHTIATELCAAGLSDALIRSGKKHETR